MESELKIKLIAGQSNTMSRMMLRVYSVHLARLDHPNVGYRIPRSAYSLSLFVCSIISGVQISYAHQMFIQPTIYDADNIVFSFDSIFWTVGVEQFIEATINGATRILTAKPPDSNLQLQLIEKYRITIMYNTPPVLITLLKNDQTHKTNVSSVKTIYMCGSKTSDLIAEISQFFPRANYVTWYGMSEFGRMFEFHHNVEGQCDGGELMHGFVAKIIDASGKHCGPNVIGEVCIRKRNKFLGYLDDLAANEAALDKDGFFRSGDIGRFDENSRFFIEDRKKNVIGVFYYDLVLLPSEIEDFLILLPEIREVCVVGIPIVDNGALPAALIVRATDSNLNQTDVYNLIAGTN